MARDAKDMVCARIGEELKQRLEEWANRKGITVSDAVREAILTLIGDGQPIEDPFDPCAIVIDIIYMSWVRHMQGSDPRAEVLWRSKPIMEWAKKCKRDDVKQLAKAFVALGMDDSAWDYRRWYELVKKAHSLRGYSAVMLKA